jgi:hypothetical protein
MVVFSKIARLKNVAISIFYMEEIWFCNAIFEI